MIKIRPLLISPTFANGLTSLLDNFLVFFLFSAANYNLNECFETIVSNLKKST